MRAKAPRMSQIKFGETSIETHKLKTLLFPVNFTSGYYMNCLKHAMSWCTLYSVQYMHGTLYALVYIYIF